MGHDRGGETEGELVDEEEPGPAHQRLGQGQHLLLAAGEVGRGLVQAHGQQGEDLEHLGPGGGQTVPIAPVEPAGQPQVVVHAEHGKMPFPPGMRAIPARASDSADRPVTLPPANSTVPAMGGHEAGDGLEQRGLARAVGAEEGDELAFGHLEVDPEEDLDGPVADVQGADRSGSGSPPQRSGQEVHLVLGMVVLRARFGAAVGHQATAPGFPGAGPRPAGRGRGGGWRPDPARRAG